MDDLIPLTSLSTAPSRECPTCGAEPGRMCSSPELGRPGFGIEHASHIHRSRE